MLVLCVVVCRAGVLAFQRATAFAAAGTMAMGAIKIFFFICPLYLRNKDLAALPASSTVINELLACTLISPVHQMVASAYTIVSYSTALCISLPAGDTVRQSSPREHP